MQEITRVPSDGGQLVLAVIAGDPAVGLPRLRMSTEAMFDAATTGFRCIEKACYDDLGCTGRADYRV